MDQNNLIGRHKGAVAYAYQEFESDRDQTVELRLGTPNGWKLWVNGQSLFAHEEYHQSARMDQYRTPVQLKAGKNAILLKICQNEQDQDWAQEWKFQIRVCDPTGTAVLPVNATQLKSVTALQK
jgi:ribosomal protein L11 methylase PrmA